ncbi:MAG TPA: PfkB family carbohydrate kinase [Candidatus Limnocylindrales bacterium]
MPARVIVVGSLNVDLVVSAPRLPRPGETVTGGTFAQHDGGKGGNQAVAAARLGAATTLVGAIGADDLGERARAALEAENVGTGELVVDSANPTGVALIVVDAAGENLIAVASGANAALTASHVATALERLEPRDSDVVLVGHEIPTATAREALRRARAAGATTILNPAPAAGLDRSVFGLADVLTPNRRELSVLVAAETRRLGRGPSDTTDPVTLARTLVAPNAEGSGATAVLVTLGASGAVLVTGSGVVELPARSVAAVDATGAGDAVNGALAAGLAAGQALEDAARRAVVAASISTTKPGARGGLPTASELQAALDQWAPTPDGQAG